MSEQQATILFSEDFSGASGDMPPAGWSQALLSGNPETDEWRFDNPGNRSFIGTEPLLEPVAVYDSDALSNDGLEESVALVSPVFDASAAEGVFLQYDQWYYGFIDPDYASQIYVEASTDGGATWTTAYVEDDEGFFIGSPIVDLTNTLAGSETAQIRFRFDGDWSYAWAIDNIEVIDYLPPNVVLPTGDVGVSEDNVPDPLDFQFVLESRPTSDVTLNFIVDESQLESIASITFSPDNWFIPQTSTVAAIADGIDEGEDQTSLVAIEVVSDDPVYDGFALDPVAVQITDSTIPGYTSYRTVEKTFEDLSSLADSNPELANWVDIGDSYDKETPGGPRGHDIYALQLTNQATDIPGYEKPILFMQGALHAREYTTTELVTRFAESLIAGYGTDPEATWLLDYTQIHIVPIMNPDGRKFAEQGYSWRKNTNPNPPPGAEPAPFPVYGVDLNRNYAEEWGEIPDGSSGEPSSLVYRGAAPFSEPETQAARDYLLDLFPDQKGEGKFDPVPDDATGVYLDIHSFGNLVLYPFGTTTERPPNYDGLRNLGLKFGYFTGLEDEAYDVQQAIGLYATDGTSDGWAYGTFGVAAYTLELGTEFFEQSDYFEEIIVPELIPTLYYAAKSAYRPYQTSEGPDSIKLQLNRPEVISGVYTRLSAIADATRYDDGNLSSDGITEGLELPEFKTIAGARYSFDAPSWVPGTEVFEMTASDGDFDGTVEKVVARLDTSGLTPGQHLVFVESQAADGTYGVPTAIFLNVLTAPENEIRGTAAAETLTGTEVADLIDARNGDDTVTGGLGDDIVFGRKGDDVLWGDLGELGSEGGNDVMYGGPGSDRMSGEAGDDTLYGETGDDVLNGNDGDDRLYGDSGDDFIFGDAGDDLIRGGRGDDTLVGDPFASRGGRDTFVLAIGEGTDKILDFEVGIDLIGLAGNLSFAQLDILQAGQNTTIQVGSRMLAELFDVLASDLTADMFVPV